MAVQCRRDDERTKTLLAVLHDETAALCAKLEREVVRQLEGDCHSPIGATAAVQDGKVTLRTAIGRRGGDLPILRAFAEAPLEQAEGLVEVVMRQLSDQHVREHLHG